MSRYYTREELFTNLKAEIDYLKLANAAMEAAIPVFEKWNGRKITKRLNTALEKVAPNLYVRISDYGGYADVRYFNYDARMYKAGTYTGYVSRDCENVFTIYDHGYTRPLDAEEWTEAARKAIRRNTRRIEQAEAFMENADEPIRAYNEAAEAYEQARDVIPAFLRDKIMSEASPYIEKIILH